MKSTYRKAAGAVLVAATLFTPSIAHATPGDPAAEGVTAPQLPSWEQQEGNPGATPQSGGGSTWAPGGFGATNSIWVNGHSTFVRNAVVAYNAGSGSLTGNVCVEQFVLNYFDGRSRTLTAGRNCAVGRTTHTFNIGKHLRNGSKVCGRVKVKDGWGNWACLTIRK